MKELAAELAEIIINAKSNKDLDKDFWFKLGSLLRMIKES